MSDAITVNCDTYYLANLAFNAPITNGATGTITGKLTASPSTVPEPSTIIMVGLGDLAVLSSRRSKGCSRP